MGDSCTHFRLVEKESGQKSLIMLQKKETTGTLVLETVKRLVFDRRDLSSKFGNWKIKEFIF